MATLSKIIGKKKYAVSLQTSSLNHLCTFREVHDYKLNVYKMDPRFNEYKKCNDPLTQDEQELLASMFCKNIIENGLSDARGVILTMSTGNKFIWDYTMDQNVDFTPIFNIVKPDSSMVLYQDYDSGSYYHPEVDEDDEDLYCELSMFSFSSNTLSEHNGKYNSLVRKLEESIPPEEAPFEVPTTGITEEAIRAYLNSRG